MFRIRYLFSTVLLGLVLCLSLNGAVRSQVPQVKVIVNPSVDDQTISVAQIRRIFSMRQTAWSNSQAITVYVLDNQHKTHQLFSTKVLGMFPYQLERIWDKLVYSGLGDEPIKVENEQEMIERVSQKPGSIGYIVQPVDIDSISIIKVLEE